MTIRCSSMMHGIYYGTKMSISGMEVTLDICDWRWTCVRVNPDYLEMEDRTRGSGRLQFRLYTGREIGLGRSLIQ